MPLLGDEDEGPGIRAPPQSSNLRRSDADLGSTNEPHALARMSRSELCAKLEMLSGDLADLRGLVTPFKVENVRLSRSLKRSRQQIQEVLQALRDFFADPTRREWFRERKDDVALCGFFQRLIAWYRAVCEEDNPTIAFYQKVWEYERGEDFKMAEQPKTDVTAKAESETTEKSRRPSASGSSPSTATSVPPPGSAAALRPGETRPSSVSLYDACRERTENLRLQEENARLRQENATLHRANSALEKELQGKDSQGAVGASGPGAYAAAAAGPKARPRPKPVRTLAKLAASDPRWERLLRDPDRLFGHEDIIDETYEQYLGDLLTQMEKHDCTFKRAIELQEETRTEPTPQSRTAAADPATPSLGQSVPRNDRGPGLGPGVPSTMSSQTSFAGAGSGYPGSYTSTPAASSTLGSSRVSSRRV